MNRYFAMLDVKVPREAAVMTRNPSWPSLGVAAGGRARLTHMKGTNSVVSHPKY
jgi:hypothetical protein